MLIRASAAFFGQRIEPGEVVPIDALSAFCITNIAFADGVKGSARAVVKVHHTQLPQLPDDSEDDEDEKEEEEEEGEGDFEEQVLTVCHLHPGKVSPPGATPWHDAVARCASWHSAVERCTDTTSAHRSSRHR